MSPPAGAPSAAGLTELIDVPGGSTVLGAEDAYPEEAPRRTTTIAAFRLEQHPVTVAQFAAFVADTGHRTRAERTPTAAELPGVPARRRLPGGLVFVPSAGPVPLDDWRRWWRFVPGASWHHPLGPLAGLDAREAMPDHPVVQVCAEDAEAYAAWAGRRLPTAGELEHAARADGPDTRYPWGEQAEPGRFERATTWRGAFPWQEARFTDPADHRRHGWVGTTPVGATPLNPWGLLDLIGNVWEWTSTPARPARAAAGRAPAGCCAPAGEPGRTAPRVVKGGSHLCAPEYCERYRPAALQTPDADTASTHIGFRCAL